MASQSVLSNANQTATPNWAGEMRYVSRQPILDLRGHVHGYELLFRDTPEAATSVDKERVVNANPNVAIPVFEQ